jgi:hypothetical protein
MKKMMYIPFCVAVIFAAPAMADADSMSWPGSAHSYLDASYIDYDLESGGVSVEPDGYWLKLSVAFTDGIFAIVDRRSVTRSGFDFDTEGYGFGMNGDAWYASYTYNTWDWNGSEFDVDTVRLGFRNDLSDRLEFNASYSWNDFEDADNEDGFQLGFVYRLTENFQLTTEYETIGGDLDVDYLSAGIRISF